MNCEYHTRLSDCDHYYASKCERCNRLICHSCIWHEDDLKKVDDDLDDLNNWFIDSWIEEMDDDMPNLDNEPCTPTK
jgi:hypothetical protein